MPIHNKNKNTKNISQYQKSTAYTATYLWNKTSSISYYQSGQALLLGLLLLSASYIAAFGFIRLARLIEEKTRLINATDAAAYSTGVMHARLLNYDAYIHQALIANEIAIAQWLSLGSWSQHIQQYQYGESYTSQLKKTGLQEYLPYYHQIHSVTSSANHLYTQAKIAAQHHDRLKAELINSQQQAHNNIASKRRQLQINIVKANLGNHQSYDIYGWHRGNFQGLNENDTQTTTETPFTQKNKIWSIQFLRNLIKFDPFLKQRNWNITKTAPGCRQADNQIIRLGSTQLSNTEGWISEDKITWQYHTHHCQKQQISLSNSQISQNSWKLKPTTILRTLSSPAQHTHLPRYFYRFRIRHRFTYIPQQFNNAQILNHDEPDDLPNHYLGLSKDFRTTVEVYFQKFNNALIEKGNLLHPSWHVRLVKLANEKGQALIESLLILMVSTILLMGIIKIGNTLQQVHQALIKSRSFAYQAAYQTDFNHIEIPVVKGSKFTYLQNHHSDTLPNDKVRAAFNLSHRGILISEASISNNKRTSPTSSIKRSTALLIDTYANKEPSHLIPEKFFHKETPVVQLNDLIKKIEVHHITPPYINQTHFWKNEMN